MSAVDHDGFTILSWLSQFPKDTGKDTHARPSHKTILERLVRPMIRRSVSPPKAVSNDMDDTAKHHSVVGSSTPARFREKVFDAVHVV